MTQTMYRDLSDDELAAFYAEAADEQAAAILRECQRRDARDRQSAADKAWWDRVSAEWFDYAHAQFLAAEAECRGNLLSKEGLKAVADPISLWSGPASRAMRLASEELRDFWDANPRLTVSQYAWHAARPGRGLQENESR